MPISQTISDTRTMVQNRLRRELASLCPDLPADAAEVFTDEDGLLVAQVHGVEQSAQASEDALLSEVRDRFANLHRIYDDEEMAALLRTLKVIAPKAGLAIAPGSLDLIELPGGVLVLTMNRLPVAASEDPLHLLSQALAHLKRRA